MKACTRGATGRLGEGRERVARGKVGCMAGAGSTHVGVVLAERRLQRYVRPIRRDVAAQSGQDESPAATASGDGFGAFGSFNAFLTLDDEPSLRFVPGMTREAPGECREAARSDGEALERKSRRGGRRGVVAGVVTGFDDPRDGF